MTALVFDRSQRNIQKYLKMNFGLFLNKQNVFAPALAITRNASKKAGSSTRNAGNSRPKHRGWRVQDSHFVSAGTILAVQRTPRFHPGLNVGLGRNGTLFAIEHGRVYVTCEQIDPYWDHTWVQRHYAGREGQPIYKKFFNVVPLEQHQRFKFIDEV